MNATKQRLQLDRQESSLVLARTPSARFCMVAMIGLQPACFLNLSFQADIRKQRRHSWLLLEKSPIRILAELHVSLSEVFFLRP